MNGATRVRRTYLSLTLVATLSQSLIWGVNTLFLLDAGLSNTQAFAANAVFSFGQLIFEVPTGVIADTKGRKASYLLGTVTLFVSTLLYLWLWWISAAFIWWALASIVMGLGFTFFSGAVEAWLVDALAANGFAGNLDGVFGQGQATMGVAMLVGSVAGGYIAQASSLGVPYAIRAGLILVALGMAAVFMRDEGFEPARGSSYAEEVKSLVKASIDHGWRIGAVKWTMLTAPALSGASFFAFYAMQPYLLELYGDSEAYGIAGIASAVVAGAQVIGGLSVPLVRRFVKRRTTLLGIGYLVVALVTAGIGLASNFWLAIGLLVVSALVGAVASPVRQAFLNGCIASEQRATVLSFDALLGSGGGAVAQPILGRVADVQGYSAAFVATAGMQVLALPFVWLARRENSPGDILAPVGEA